jgi:hypothetical protein
MAFDETVAARIRDAQARKSMCRREEDVRERKRGKERKRDRVHLPA